MGKLEQQIDPITKLLDELARIRVEYKDTQPQERFEQINKSLSSLDGLMPVIDKDLGIKWGALGIANDETNKFELHTKCTHRPDNTGLEIHFPYLTTKNSSEEIRRLMIWMFSQRRGAQVLHSDSKFIEESSFDIGPEFYRHLIALDQCLLSDPKSNAEGVLENNCASQEKQNQQRHTAHYCTIGEMLFFYVMWRSLWRFIQVRGSEEAFSPEVLLHLSLTYDRPVSDLYEIESLPGSGLPWPEHDLISTIKDTTSEPVWKDVAHVVDSVGKPLTVALEYDLRHLGLLASAEDTTADPNILNYALAKYSLGILTILANSNNNKLDVVKLKQVFENVMKKHATKRNISKHEVIALVAAVQTVGTSLLQHPKPSESLPATDLLEVLHRIVRFPVMEYFYWTAIEHDQVAHLVFPIWRSPEYPVKVTVPRALSNEPIETDIVAVCLLGVKPIAELDWTIPKAKYNKTRLRSLHPGKLLQIVQFCEELGRLIIDHRFYKEIVTEQEKKWEALRHESTLSHDSVGIVEWAYRNIGRPSTVPLLWNLKMMMNAGSSLKVRPDMPVFESDNFVFEDWPRIPVEFLRKLSETAVIQALFRSMLKNSRLTYAQNVKMKEAVVKMLGNPDPGKLALDMVELELLNADALGDWVYHLGFVSMFTNCIWPAAQHALIAAIVGEIPNSLSILCRSDGLTILNKSAVPIEDATSKNRLLYKKLQTRFDNAVLVEDGRTAGANTFEYNIRVSYL